jgi:hypothetical protein
MARDIDVLNEMEAAGARFFAGGLGPASSAKSLRAQPDGKVRITYGPYLETKEHIGGFWILEAANLDEALEWGARLSSPVGRRSRCARFSGGPIPDNRTMSYGSLSDRKPGGIDEIHLFGLPRAWQVRKHA